MLKQMLRFKVIAAGRGEAGAGQSVGERGGGDLQEVFSGEVIKLGGEGVGGEAKTGEERAVEKRAGWKRGGRGGGKLA
jgi:hypothetical protein